MISTDDIGKRVLVSDGTPRPPERFNRKLADWKHRNYAGKLTAINPANEYYKQVTADIEASRNSIMIITRSGVPLDKITLIEE